MFLGDGALFSMPKYIGRLPTLTHSLSAACQRSLGPVERRGAAHRYQFCGSAKGLEAELQNKGRL